MFWDGWLYRWTFLTFRYLQVNIYLWLPPWSMDNGSLVAVHGRLRWSWLCSLELHLKGGILSRIWNGLRISCRGIEALLISAEAGCHHFLHTTREFNFQLWVLKGDLAENNSSDNLVPFRRTVWSFKADPCISPPAIQKGHLKQVHCKDQELKIRVEAV